MQDNIFSKFSLDCPKICPLKFLSMFILSSNFYNFSICSAVILENEEFEAEDNDVCDEGKRICDIAHLFAQIRKYKCPRVRCTAGWEKTRIRTVKDSGLKSTVYVECEACRSKGLSTPVLTPIQLTREDERPDVNESMVLWCVFSGNGEFHAEQLMAYLGVKPMNGKFRKLYFPF